MLMSEMLYTGYESLIPSLSLPDKNDRHVLAAAIRCQASAIVTFNLKDFPQELNQFLALIS
jgi:predicted nucleic acid-binding protein